MQSMALHPSGCLQSLPSHWLACHLPLTVLIINILAAIVRLTITLWLSTFSAVIYIASNVLCSLFFSAPACSTWVSFHLGRWPWFSVCWARELFVLWWLRSFLCSYLLRDSTQSCLFTLLHSHHMEFCILHCCHCTCTFIFSAWPDNQFQYQHAGMGHINRKRILRNGVFTSTFLKYGTNM